MQIMIPTFRRGPERQKTYDILQHASVGKRFDVALVCPPDEVKAFSAAGYRAIACRAKGIAATRQWILDNAESSVVLMLDDDLNSWSERQETDPVSYRKATSAAIMQNLSAFGKRMEKYAHGAIGHRLFCQNHDPVYFNNRMLRALAYNVPKLKAMGVKFRLPVMEDFDVQLQLMTKGEECIIWNRLVQDQSASNAAGGCSEYRTGQVQADAAYELARRWPGIVTVVQRATKSGWEGMEQRVDVRVNWRAAIRKGLEYRHANA